LKTVLERTCYKDLLENWEVIFLLQVESMHKYVPGPLFEEGL
jgi:hypothetical protein